MICSFDVLQASQTLPNIPPDMPRESLALELPLNIPQGCCKDTQHSAISGALTEATEGDFWILLDDLPKLIKFGLQHLGTFGMS